MRKLLTRIGLAFGALLVMALVAYAAWTQGEARGYARGYDGGKRDERAADTPRLTAGIVTALVTTGKPEARNSNCKLDASYAGSGLWIVSVSNDNEKTRQQQELWQQALQQQEKNRQQQEAERISRLEEMRRIEYERVRQDFIDRESARERNGQISYGLGALEREAGIVAQQAASKVTLDMPRERLFGGNVFFFRNASNAHTM